MATAVYRAIPAAFRVAMHGQAAAVVSTAGLGVTSVARHLLEVHPESDPWVVRQLREAARDSLRSGAPEAARRCLARALREPPALDERADVLFELGCSALLTEPATTVNHLRAALDEPVLAPALREMIVYRLAQALGHSDRMAEAAETVAEAAREATDARTRLHMQAEQFMWNAFRADEPDSPARSRRLARLAEHLTGRSLAERYILGLRAWDAMVRGESAETALHYAREALGDGMSWTDDQWGFEVPVLVALTFMYCDQPGQAEELFNAGIAECERKGWRGAHLSFGFTLLGYIRYRRGRLDEAETLVRAGLRIADRVGRNVPAQYFAIGILIEILLARGRTSDAHDVAVKYGYGDVVPSAVVYPDSQTVHSELLLALGRRREAEYELARVGLRLEPRGMRNPAWCPWRLHLARATDNPEHAAALAAEALEMARRFGTQSAIGQALHTTASITENAAERLRLLADAVAHLERSPPATTSRALWSTTASPCAARACARRPASSSTAGWRVPCSAAPTPSPSAPARNSTRRACGRCNCAPTTPGCSPPRSARWPSGPWPAGPTTAWRRSWGRAAGGDAPDVRHLPEGRLGPRGPGADDPPPVAATVPLRRGLRGARPRWAPGSRASARWGARRLRRGADAPGA
ncbi:hypothetical protein ACFQ60_20435 [Streptomyces zhihengii]